MQCCVLTIEHSNGNSFGVLAPIDGIMVIQNAASSPSMVPYIIKQWIYLHSTNPVGSTDIASFQATGSKLIVQVIDTSGSAPRRLRFYLRNGTSATITPTIDPKIPNIPPPPSTIAVGQYIDALGSGFGGMTAFDGPYNFNEQNPPAGSANLITQVDTERTARGIA